MTKILIADDEASIRTILSGAMTRKGFEVERAASGDQALQALKAQNIDVAILDIRMPGISGLEILNHREEFPSKPSIFIITAQDTMENAVEAMKRGAYDYLTKPFDLDEVSILVDRALETRKLQSEVELLRHKVSSPQKKATLVGSNRAIQDIYKTIGKIADQDVTVLIQGESGTGKELVAKAIHYQGKRANQPFIAVNCSAIPGNLLESELFGYRKGAFTGAVLDKAGLFEQAEGGTIFLDEIGDMPLELQAKLLRVLQEKEVQRLGDTRAHSINVRIIAATNQPLEKKVREDTFREDLYFRLNVVPISIPPLRERRNDIPVLVDFFLSRIASELGIAPKHVTSKAMNYLQNQNWTGNVRELENTIKRVFVLTQGSILEDRDFKLLGSAATLDEMDRDVGEEFLEKLIAQKLTKNIGQLELEEADLYNKYLPLVERPLIIASLQKTRGNQVKAAKLMGINRNTLRKRIRELKINYHLSDEE